MGDVVPKPCDAVPTKGDVVPKGRVVVPTMGDVIPKARCCPDVSKRDVVPMLIGRAPAQRRRPGFGGRAGPSPALGDPARSTVSATACRTRATPSLTCPGTAPATATLTQINTETAARGATVPVTAKDRGVTSAVHGCDNSL